MAGLSSSIENPTRAAAVETQTRAGRAGCFKGTP
jgi:hypothetical protein